MNIQSIESEWGWDYLHPSGPALWLTQTPVKWVMGLFQGCKTTGCGVYHTQPPSTNVKERALLNLYIPSGPFPGRTLPFTSHPEHFIHTSVCQVMWSYSTVTNLQKSILHKERNSIFRGFLDICGNADADTNMTTWMSRGSFVIEITRKTYW